MILILSVVKGDPHLFAVTRALDQRGARWFCFDPACVTQGGGLLVDPERRVIEEGGRRLDLREVDAVWLRRPGNIRCGRLAEPEAEWVAREWEHATRGLWDLLDVGWINAPDANRRASRKVRQLTLAAELGLSVPRWLVCNQPEEALAFIGDQPERVVVKALASPTLLYANRAVMLYTHRLRRDDLQFIDAVRYGPIFLQSFVEKRADVRVTVVGPHLFAVAIDPDGTEAAQTDFRSVEIFDLQHRRIALPAVVEARCRELVRRLGLVYGAIDLLLDKEGEWQFLEINPNGQWLWLEMMTGAPIAAAIASVLMDSGQRRHP